MIRDTLSFVTRKLHIIRSRREGMRIARMYACAVYIASTERRRRGVQINYFLQARADSQSLPHDIDNKDEVIQKKLDRFGHLFHGFPSL